MFTTDQVRRTFTDWAPRYDATHAWHLLKRREARLALEVQPGDRVLEIACGTGLNFPHLRQLIGERGRVVGVDLTPAMLDLARQAIARRGWQNVAVREADAAQLPFADAAFEKVFCAFALNIIPEYEQAVAEARRVLVPGGRFVSLEMQVMDASSLSGWLGQVAHRLMGLCAVDTSHRTLEAVQALRPGGRFVSAGPKRVGGPRGWIVNPVTQAVARAAAVQPLVARPWTPLQDRLGRLTVEEHWLGAAYIAHGTRPTQPLSTSPLGAPTHVHHRTSA